LTGTIVRTTRFWSTFSPSMLALRRYWLRNSSNSTLSAVAVTTPVDDTAARTTAFSEMAVFFSAVVVRPYSSAKAPVTKDRPFATLVSKLR
jgi:hypothetical protein